MKSKSAVDVRIEFPSAGATYNRAEYGVYEYGTYPRSSVLAGQERRVFMDAFPTLEEAQAKYPSAEVCVAGSGYHAPDLSHLPDDDDDDDRPRFRTHTWTAVTYVCLGCGYFCYASREALDAQRAFEGEHLESQSDEDIAHGFDYCLSCIEGKELPGERAIAQPSGHRKTITSAERQQYIDGDTEWLKGPVWELRGLTPEHVRELVDLADRARHRNPIRWYPELVEKIDALALLVREAELVQDSDDGDYIAERVAERDDVPPTPYE